MKNKHRFLAAVCALSTVACHFASDPSSYRVSGSVPDTSLNGKTVYMVLPYRNRVLDSAIVKDGRFVFEGSVKKPLLCTIDASGKYVMLILENGRIQVDFDTHLPAGTPLNDELALFFAGQDSLQRLLQQEQLRLSAEADPKARLQRSRAYFESTWKPAWRQWAESFYKRNSDNELGSCTLLAFAKYATPDQVDALLERAGETVLKNPGVGDMKRRQAALRKTAVGRPYTDFTVVQENGSRVSLSDYVETGVYTLVDFWASWNTACRQEMPAMAELYGKYKDKGFRVVGVAVWDDPDRTKEAIGALGIDWPQMLNVWRTAEEVYGINAIPANILIAPDGSIAARDLHGDELRLLVDSVVNR